MPTTTGQFKIPYTEIPQYTESLNNDSSEAVRVLECAWNHRPYFVRDLLGYSVPGDGPNVSRFIPEQHPEVIQVDGFPTVNMATYYAVDAKLIMGLGVPDQDPTTQFLRYLDKVPTDPIPPVGDEVFGRARYQVLYRQLDYDVLSNTDVAGRGEGGVGSNDPDELYRYVSRYPTFSVRNFDGFRPSFIQYTNFPTDPIPALPALPYPLVELTYKWWQVPDPYPVAAINLELGTVNRFAFDYEQQPLTGGYPAQTLMFLGSEVERKKNIAGFVTWNVTYKFSFNQYGWNNIYRFASDVPSGTPFQPVQRKNNSSLGIFSQADFSSLFEIT